MEYRHTITCTNDSDSVTLDISPIGWDEKGYTLQENQTYHGVLSAITIKKLGFLPNKKDKIGGLDFILSKYELYGVEANLTDLIEYLDHSTNTYVTWANCRLSWLDSPEYTSSEKAFYMQLTDTSDREKLRENDELVVDALSGEDLEGNAITVNSFDTLTITPQALFLEYRGNADNDSGERLLTETGDYATNSIEITNTIGDDITIDGVVKKIYTNNTGDTITAKVSLTGVERIIDLGLFTDLPGQTGNLTVNYSFRIVRRNSGGTAISTTVIESDSDVINFTTSYDGQLTNDFDYSIDFIMADGDYLELYSSVTLVVGTDIDTSNSTWSLSNTYVLQLLQESKIYDYNVDVDGLMAHEALENILQIITGNTSPLYSPILGRTDIGYDQDGFLGLVCITNGLLIRRMPNSLAKLNLSFRDLFTSLNAIHPIYLGYDTANSRFIIDSIENRYDDTEIVEIDNPAGFKRIFKESLYFNEIKSGQKNKVEYDNFNGVEEAITPYTFGTSISVKGIYDCQSPYNLDPTGVEVQRRELYFGTGSEDKKNDGNVYILRVDRSASKYITKVLGVGEEAVNIYNGDTRLNLEFTAKRNLIRHGKIISSIYHKNASGVFKYLSSQLKSDMGTKLSGESSFVYENTDVNVSDLGTHYLIPETIEFSYPISDSLLTTLLANPNGKVKVNTDIGTFYGYISLDGVRSDAYDRQGNWVLQVSSYSLV